MTARRLSLTVLVLLVSVASRSAAQTPPDTATRPKPDTTTTIDSSAPKPDTMFSPAVSNPVTDSSLPPRRIVWLVDRYPIVRARLDELNGTAPTFPVIWSTSSLFWSGAGRSDGVWGILPQGQLVTNSSIPYSRNDGGLWAGKGSSTRISGGVAAKYGVLRVVIAPEIFTTQNDSFPPRTGAIIPTPPIPAGRSSFSFPWYANGPYSLDMPIRFGDKARKQLRLGQTSILADLRGVSLGFSTENEWWGPGIDNALVLSDNAPGFPHLLIASARPFATRVGKVDFRWLVGGLKNSAFFDTATNKNTRSISTAVVAIRPRGMDNLSVGVARTVIGTSTGWGEIPLRWLEVFHNTGHPNDGAPYDSTLHPGGRDQLYSVFARWVLPASGAEIYGEWGRLDFPRNLRDMLVQPNRGQAYTLGLQWTRQAFTPSGRLHFRVENTSLEQTLAQRNRFAGVWYTSRRVLEGFTNEGEVLGAAVGPGSSGQSAELNYLAHTGFFGFEFGRTRYNEDVRQVAPMVEYLRWCSHDIGLQYGLHGGLSRQAGTLSFRFLAQNRLNAWFQGGHGCPRSEGMVDIRNRNLTITFSPGVRW